MAKGLAFRTRSWPESNEPGLHKPGSNHSGQNKVHVNTVPTILVRTMFTWTWFQPFWADRGLRKHGPNHSGRSRVHVNAARTILGGSMFTRTRFRPFSGRPHSDALMPSILPLSTFSASDAEKVAEGRMRCLRESGERVGWGVELIVPSRSRRLSGQHSPK